MALGMVVCLTTPPPVGGRDGRVPEHQLKAAFLFNFAKYVDWPTEAFPEATTPIRFGILGENPFEGALQRIIEAKTIGNRPLTLTRSRRIDELESCHLLYISRSEEERVDSLLNGLQGQPVLTVSDIDRFARSGGMIELFLQENRIAFKINRTPVEESNLKMSSRLLNLATIVSPRETEGDQGPDGR